MNQPANFELKRSGEYGVLALTGDWTSLGLGRAGQRLAGALRSRTVSDLDLSGLGAFDTAGAFALTNAGAAVREAPGRPDVERLLKLVDSVAKTDAKGPGAPRSVYAMLVRAGLGIEKVLLDAYHTLAFLGRLIATLGQVVLHPGRLRAAPVVALMERAGLDALPIIVATNFFIGATVGFIGASLLAQFGASVFSVELIGVAVLREFAVLITAVLLAGRSASSFAAELGAMKMNQEIDAMQVMGVDPFEALVLPRFIAMLTMTPLLTFVAMLSGLTGGMVVTWATLDLSPAFFLQRLLDNVGVVQLYLGLAKAPVLAMVIAAIGCRQGLEVGGDVEQLGRRVTTAVVQAIFSIIALDAAFALIFMEMGV